MPRQPIRQDEPARAPARQRTRGCPSAWRTSRSAARQPEVLTPLPHPRPRRGLRPPPPPSYPAPLPRPTHTAATRGDRARARSPRSATPSFSAAALLLSPQRLPSSLSAARSPRRTPPSPRTSPRRSIAVTRRPHSTAPPQREGSRFSSQRAPSKRPNGAPASQPAGARRTQAAKGHLSSPLRCARGSLSTD